MSLAWKLESMLNISKHLRISTPVSQHPTPRMKRMRSALLVLVTIVMSLSGFMASLKSRMTNVTVAAVQQRCVASHLLHPLEGFTPHHPLGDFTRPRPNKDFILHHQSNAFVRLLLENYFSGIRQSVCTPLRQRKLSDPQPPRLRLSRSLALRHSVRGRD